MRRITTAVEASAVGATSSTADALALLPLPKVSALTGLQARGAVCVWCQAGLTIETAVDLGERPGPGGITLFPRGCAPCARRLASRVYRIHVANCRACLRNVPCDERTALRKLASEGSA